MEAEGGIEPPSTALQAAVVFLYSMVCRYCLRFLTFSAGNQCTLPGLIEPKYFIGNITTD